MRKAGGIGTVIMRVALVLVLLTLASAHLLSGMLARYATTAEGGDAARVAKFYVHAAGAGTKDVPQALAIDGIGDAPCDTYEFTVTSDSEVAVDADLELSLNMALPEGVTMTLDNVTDGASPVSIAVPDPVVDDNDVNYYTFTEFAHFDPVASAETQTFRLSFTGGEHGSIVESALVNFNLSVTMSQAD